jgi:hypothetical protein
MRGTFTRAFALENCQEDAIFFDDRRLASRNGRYTVDTSRFLCVRSGHGSAGLGIMSQPLSNITNLHAYQLPQQQIGPLCALASVVQVKLQKPTSTFMPWGGTSSSVKHLCHIGPTLSLCNQAEPLHHPPKMQLLLPPPPQESFSRFQTSNKSR